MSLTHFNAMEIHAAYAGCGTDMAPILVFSGQIKKFVQIDSQPRSEFGHLVRKEQERPNFLTRFRKQIQALGFRQVSHLNNNIVFTRNSIEVSLWQDSALPLENVDPRMLFELEQCRCLFICGHFPHPSLMDLVQERPILITNNQTAIEYLHDEYAIPQKPFSAYYRMRAPRHVWHSVFVRPYEWTDKSSFQVTREL